MNHIGIILLFMLIGGSIGWVTNKIAIYFLFHPKKPKKFLFWTVQGIFPKRQNAIAERFSTLFVQEFFTSDMIHKELFSEKNLSKIYSYLDESLKHFMDTNIKEKYPLIGLFISENRKSKVRQEILEMVAREIAEVTTNFETRLLQVIDIKQIIEDKIKALDTDQVNDVMQKIMDKELKFIEISGAILGGLIGLLQGVLAIVLQ